MIVSGDFRPAIGRSQAEVRDAIAQHGGKIHSDVKWSTDLLVRAESSAWKHGDFGERERELADNKAQGRDVGVIDAYELLQLFDGKGVWAREPMSPATDVRPIGKAYANASTPKELIDLTMFERDPAEFERALAGHVTTQNALASFVTSLGLVPLSPAGSAAQFDLAWTVQDVIWVAEVKSLTATNESIQLRLGLGQVLEYGWRLARHPEQPVRTVLVPERVPLDISWSEIPAASGAVLSWPGEFASLRQALASDLAARPTLRLPAAPTRSESSS